MKRILTKATEAGEDPYLAILNYRASPLENGLSPAEILMKRKLRTRLPSAKHQMEQRVPSSPKVKQTEVYNRTAKPLSPLAQEEIMRVRCDGQWGPLAKVVKETTPRSYEVITEHGNTLRRNRRHLLKVPPNKTFTVMDSNTNDMMISSQAEQPEKTDTHILPETDKNKDGNVKRQIVRPKRLIEEM